MKVRKNKKGFTLIELLAVIVILGLLMAIAIPSVTKYITESRKKTLTTTLGNYIGALVNDVNDLSYTFTGQNTIYAVPIECISLERGGTNPFGHWYQANDSYFAYVLIQYDDINSKYVYGFTFKDSAGYGLYPTIQANINERGSQVKTGYTINKPKTGELTSLVTLTKWQESGFKVDSSTYLQVLEATSEGQTGDGINTCTLAQKGDNYAQVEEEKANGGGSEEDGNDEITVTCTSTEDCTWEEIKVISEAGKGDEYFNLGDTKSFTTTDGTEVVMEIVAFNSDTKADGSGNAGITWISSDTIAYHEMNTTKTNANGWAASSMRAWLQSDFYSSIPTEITSVIISVNKKYYDYTSKSTKSCIDNVWIPSASEMFGIGWSFGSEAEDSIADYSDYFNIRGRRKHDASGTPVTWNVRTATSSRSDSFYYLSVNGRIETNYAPATSSRRVVLGFCT